MILPRSYYARSPLVVAPELLGCLVVREMGGTRLIGRIVEVEAYLGAEDAASHAFRGPSARNRVMFGPAGHAYVYFIYGNHFCLNAVTGAVGKASAVLIRALEPVMGIEEMVARRGQRASPERAEGSEVGGQRSEVRNRRQWIGLSNGPGKLCQALGIERGLNDHDLTLGVDLWLETGFAHSETIGVSPRVGVRGDEAAIAAPWRFFLAGNPFVTPTPINRAAP